ncbi:hypothetical protein NV379_14600 [Paenibacillus sp. N1-5-1-14]|uniref:hypothetical protein n=1 Tax=Paenibacillus radicibacter TaxID=2972488 RepID=UPI002158D981|nr:hypothetical protein [Paenibacillus radicibacter]MCR8643883.1 hypothetical protein [Paenibacillus radicibacter]
MSYSFIYDDRLGIETPQLEREWEEYSTEERCAILLRWEQIRGTIPERIKQIERVIIAKQRQLDQEDNFEVSCELNSSIADRASRINDLHLWFRVNQEIEVRMHG